VLYVGAMPAGVLTDYTHDELDPTRRVPPEDPKSDSQYTYDVR
jgi:hypothetical protein